MWWCVCVSVLDGNNGEATPVGATGLMVEVHLCCFDTFFQLCKCETKANLAPRSEYQSCI